LAKEQAKWRARFDEERRARLDAEKLAKEAQERLARLESAQKTTGDLERKAKDGEADSSEATPTSVGLAPRRGAEQPEPDGPHVVLQDGDPVPLRVVPGERVSELRARVAVCLKVPADQVRLSSAGEMLSDSATVGGGPNKVISAVLSSPPNAKMLFVAALQGDISELMRLISEGADLNVRYSGRPNRSRPDKLIDATPLHMVVTSGNAAVTQVLLKGKADVEARMKRAIGKGKSPQEIYGNVTALHLAAMEGHSSIVEMLLGCGANAKAELHFSEERDPGKSRSERFMTPFAVASEMASKGHNRDAVIAVLKASLGHN